MSLFRSLSTVGGFTLLSRVLGFVRDLVLARIFGASAATDAFFVAFKIPNFMRRLFAEGAFATAFVPVLTEYKTQRSKAELQRFVDHVSGSLGLVLLGVTVLGVLAAPVLVSGFAFGWYLGEQTEKLALAAEMLRLTFPYLFFISLTALAGGILNSHNRFAVPSFTPVVLNIVLIAVAIFLSPQLDPAIMALAWGVFIAGIAQLFFQLPFLHRLQLLPKPKPDFKDEGVRRIMKLMLPALFAVSVTQINLLLDTVLASFLVTGSISWLYYSDRLLEFPLGVLGVALGTVILPKLSAKHAEDSPEGFQQTLDWAIRVVLLLGLPATIGLAVLAGPMIATLFLSDVFTPDDVAMARLSLMAYASGLLGFMLIKVLAPGYYARQDTKTPVKIGVIAMLSNMLFNLILIFPLAHAGLALATAMSAFLNASLLLRGLLKLGVYQPKAGWWILPLQAILAGVGMGLLLWFGSPDLDAWIEQTFWQRAGRLGLWIALGGLVYFAILLVLGVRPKQFKSA